MSRRIIRSGEPNRYSASALAISVLPVPVGPTNSSTACGRVGSVSPALTRATRSTTPPPPPPPPRPTRPARPAAHPAPRGGKTPPRGVGGEPLALVEQRQRQPRA